MRPTLNTPRLTLRPYRLSDAPRVQQLAGEKIIADMTANIPHPYENGMAGAWIQQHDDWFQSGQAVALAITLKDTDEIIGTISLTQIDNGCGNLGYWLGVPYWGQGIVTEAARELIRYGVEDLGLTRLVACHLQENYRSGRVIEKCDFTYLKTTTVKGRAVKHYERLTGDRLTSPIRFEGIADPYNDDVFQRIKTGLHPYVDNVFGWDDNFQRQRIKNEYQPDWFYWALTDDQCLGLVCFKRYDQALHLHLIIVDEAFRGQGYGKRIMQAIHDCADDEARAVTLSCFRCNTPALRLYETLGYTITSEEPDFLLFRRPGKAESANASIG